jgi:hypothetical protein
MSFWDVSNPAKPKGIKDPNAVLDFPVSFAAWLADVSDTYASHTVTVTGGLVCDSSTQSAGVITLVLSAGTLGETASFTIRIVTAGGRTDERTFYLSIKDR